LEKALGERKGIVAQGKTDVVFAEAFFQKASHMPTFVIPQRRNLLKGRTEKMELCSLEQSGYATLSLGFLLLPQ
jgi:hypothetical protein